MPQAANDDDDPLVQIIEDMTPFWTVAIYLVDRSPAGPEEGGWWFDHGDRIEHTIAGLRPDHLLTIFHRLDSVPDYDPEERAYAYASALQKVVDHSLNNDGANRDLNSVNCEGRYVAMVHAGFPPKYFPERRPYYE